MRPDQDWCLNCGLAITTEVAGAPGWRTPVAIVSAVLVIGAIALVVAFLQLSGESAKVAEAPAATPSPAAVVPPPAAATPPPAPVAPPPTPGAPGAVPSPTGAGTTAPAGPAPSPTPAPNAAIGHWPMNTTAFTVILYSGTTRALARAKAKSLAAVPDIGILRSGRYSTLRKGYFVVFSGQYKTLAPAQAAAKAAQSGAPGAYAKQVKPR